MKFPKEPIGEIYIRNNEDVVVVIGGVAQTIITLSKTNKKLSVIENRLFNTIKE